MQKGAVPVDYHDDKRWDVAELAKLGYQEDGDRQLLEKILKFTRVLLHQCGNRSIYASSAHLNHLLNSTSLSVIEAVLDVGHQLALRYQASVKRMGGGFNSRQITSALLANHYNIDLERIHQLSQPFVKTPIAHFTPEPHPFGSPGASKGKEKAQPSAAKNASTMYANDLVAIAGPSQTDNARWNGWGDIKITYYPANPVTQDANQNAPDTTPSAPATPTPMRRSATTPQHRSPRVERNGGRSSDDSPPPANVRSPGAGSGDAVGGGTSPKVFEIPQAAFLASSIHDLLARCPEDMPKASRYELLNRLRIAKALLGSLESRQLALGVRLSAINNLTYIYPEATFVEKAMRQDNDEPRRYQLTYQLVELIHPSVAAESGVPLWLQTIALHLLEGISTFQLKYPDVLSALNANVNHGVLLYVMRKTVAEIKVADDDDVTQQSTAEDQWRTQLFSLALHMTMGNRDMVSAGLMEILVDVLNTRSKIANRNTSMVLAFLDGVIYNIQGAFQAFVSAHGLDSISQLIIDTASMARTLVESGEGTKPEFRSSVVDYEIPYAQQQTLKWLLKCIHHIMANQFSFGGNTDRLLRNLADNSKLLSSMRDIMENTTLYGSVVWTNAVTILSDLINNDPTSFTAILESGMIQSFLEAVTCRPLPTEQPKQPAEKPRDAADDEQPEEDPSSPESEASLLIVPDDRPHPPTEEALGATRPGPLAGGVLPSQDAISIIPSILNSISLNNAGIKMVVTSRVFDSYFEIFESPAHVQCMENNVELPRSIGNSFDELARHHPSLRAAISDAVLDMVARVVHLGKTKAETAGWGAKIVAPGAPEPPESGKGKEKATAEEDVEMTDVGDEQNADSVPDSEHGGHTVHNDITPYIDAVATFLHNYFSNSILKQSFAHQGGIQLVLDLSELPSLPHDFTLDTPAPRTLQHVVSQLMEQAPMLGLPSLVRRTQAAVDGLRPLAAKGSSEPFFGRFLQTEDAGGEDHISDEDLAEATGVVKALVNSQSLIKTLSNCFPPSTSTSRQGALTLHPVNIFDYYTRLIESLGGMLHTVLTEEMGVTTLTPKHWNKRLVTVRSSESPIQPGTDDASLQEALSTAVAKVGDDSSPPRLKKPTRLEQASPAYRNYQVLRVLLHSFMPTTFPFFQQIGKALLPRRPRLPTQRSYHIRVAEALAETIRAQLTLKADPSTTDYHYWIVMLHTLHEMMIDPVRHGERTSLYIVTPVLVAFKEQGGFDTLNEMLRVFMESVAEDLPSTESTKPKLAALGARKILEFYDNIVHGKNTTDSAALVEIVSRNQDRHYNNIGGQLLVELRMAVLPVVKALWESADMEKIPTSILSKVVSILKTIAGADQESGAGRRSEKTPRPAAVFTRDSLRFEWAPLVGAISQLAEADGVDQDLAREAIYRAQGNREAAAEYCRAHTAGLGGPRNPIPAEDAFRLPSPPEADDSAAPPSAASAPAPVAPEAMAVDEPVAEVDFDRLLQDNALAEDLVDAPWQESDHEQDTSSHHSESHDASGDSVAVAGQEGVAGTTQDSAKDEKTTITREDLDDARANLQVDLIDRCLDVIRAHPDSVCEVSDLISATALKSHSDDGRQEVAETMVNALMSFAIDDETKKSSAKSIAAYAHLLSLLLHESDAFFKCCVKTLRDSIGVHLSFLTLPPGNAAEELPPWIPYILLVFEMVLKEDEQVVEAKWKVPAAEDDPVEEAVLQVKEPIVSDDQRRQLLDAIIDILPRVGKDDTLAVTVLRILVILTRKRSFAQAVGEKKNLQRLFVMAKQLSGCGAGRLKESRISFDIVLILRHIVEDDDIVRQLMRSEIRNYFESSHRASSRPYELNSFVRALSHVALRSPEIFVEVVNDMVKLASKWSPPPTDVPSFRSSPVLALKTIANDEGGSSVPKDDSVEPAVQATQGLNISDVRPSAEDGDKVMTDASKASVHEHKRPIIGHSDGVITFLLDQLLNYQKVDDAEPAPTSKDQPTVDSDPPAATEASSSTSAEPSTEGKEKKASKPIFKTEDHPIYIYRCFLLHCLTELTQSYNCTKIEFINYKRGALLQSNTPVKPRASVLNYLLNDLLFTSSLATPGEPATITANKKAATSEQARLLLVALVSKTSETPIDRNRDRFEFDDEPDLLFVRKFVLDTILRAYKEAATGGDPFDARYTKMLSLAELLNHMTGERELKDPRRAAEPLIRSQNQLKRLMYEKGYLTALTASIADIDLTFPGVKRTIKYILRVLRVLTATGVALSRANILPSTSPDNEDDLASISSLSSIEDNREETPDLYRNSALGMMEPDDSDGSEGSHDDGMHDAPTILRFAELTVADDEVMYVDAYDETIEYEEEVLSADGENDISEDEDEDLGEMGPMEGLPGDSDIIQGVIDDEDDGDDGGDDSMDEDEDSPDDDDEAASEAMDELEEIVDEVGEAMHDGGSEWESDSSEEDDGEAADFDEAQGLDEMAGDELGRFENIVRAAMNADDLGGAEISNFDDQYGEEGPDEDGASCLSCLTNGGDDALLTVSQTRMKKTRIWRRKSTSTTSSTVSPTYAALASICAEADRCRATSASGYARWAGLGHTRC